LLGYYPFPPPETLGERLLACRRHLGLSRKRLARNLGIDEMRLARWERGTSSPEERHEERIGRILASIS
jgi:transcriptional regulator with XRE-family HTH domain